MIVSNAWIFAAFVKVGIDRNESEGRKRFMKKRYIVMAGIAAVAEALLLGCGARLGADGGTEEIGLVSEAEKELDGEHYGNTNKEESEENSDTEEQDSWKRMVMLNGKLYVDTNETDNHMLRCGVMDGEITSTTEGEAPTENGQSNFGKDISFQYGMRENRIEIFVDDSWCIFAYNENNIEGLTMTVSDITEGGCIVHFQNDSGRELTFGEDFSLEKLYLESDGTLWENEKGEAVREWEYVPVVVYGDWGFNSIGYPVENGTKRDWSVDWTWLYGNLEPGTYRIVKGVSDTTGEDGYTSYTISAEFEVVSTHK